MGDDFSNIQVSTGSKQQKVVRASLITAIPDLLKSNGYKQVRSFRRCNRVIVIGPAGSEPWITIYDSAAYRTDYDLIKSAEDTQALARALSEAAGAVITIDMEDSAALHLCLLVQGKQIDQYADHFSLYKWRDEAHKAEWRGKEHLWVKHLNLTQAAGSALREAWDMRDDEHYLQYDLQDRLVEILRWNEDMCWDGYTLGMDGVPYVYSMGRDIKKEGFTELYFLKK